MDLEALKEVYTRMEELRKRWCAEEDIDDAEEMWQDIPPFLDWAAPAMGRALGLLPPPLLVITEAYYGCSTTFIDVKNLVSDMVIKERSLSLNVLNTTFKKDPCPGLAKKLKLFFMDHQEKKYLEIPEGMRVIIEDGKARCEPIN